MDNSKKKGNPLWVAGVSGNLAGRKAGTKTDPLKRLRRWINRRGTERELDRIYINLETGKEKLEMFKAVWYYTLPRPVADALSTEEAQLLYEQRVQLEQKNKQLIQRVKELEDAISKQAI